MRKTIRNRFFNMSLVKRNQKRTSLMMGGLLVVGAFISSAAQADGSMRTAKTLQSPQTLKVGEVAQYRLDFACDSLVGDCGSLTIIDNIPAELEILGCTVPPGFTLDSCVPGSNYVEATKDANFLDGESFNMTIVTRVRLDLDPLPSGPIVNTADMTISTGPDGNPLTQHPQADPVIVDPGEPQYKVYKARVDPAPPALPAPDTGVTYTVQMCALNGTGNVEVTAPTLSDTFQAGAMLIPGALDEPTATVSGNNISWTLDDFDLAAYYATHDVSEPYCQARSYVLVYPEANFPAGSSISNTVIGDGVAVGYPSPFPVPGDNTASIDEVTGPEAPAVGMSKYADDVLGGGGPMVWHLNADINLSNVPVLDLVLYEEIPQVPAAMFPLSISSGTWNSILNFNGQSDVRANIEYSSDPVVTDCSAVSNWVDLGGGQIASPILGIAYPLPANASCVRWAFEDVSSIASAPAVPRGWDFVVSPRLSMDVAAVPGPYPVTVENCIYSYYDDDGVPGGATAVDGPICGEAFIEGPTPAIDVLKTRVTPMTDLNPGQEFTQRLSFVHINGDSTGPTVNPILADLLPPELEFVRWDAYTGVGTEPDPVMEVIDNYNGTGRTMVRFSWSASAPAGSVNIDLSDASGTNNSASFADTLSDSNMPRMDVILQVKAGTVTGSYVNVADVFDDSAITATCADERFEITDGIDLNGDGDTDDSFCAGQANIIVIEAAVLGGRKYVQGTQDPAIPNEDDPTSDPAIVDSACEGAPLGLTRFPCVAQTGRVAPNNDFHYELELVNSGNVFLEDYYLYDLLPKVGDTGSGPGLVNAPRLSTWEPDLAGAITPVAGSFVDINGNPLDPALYTSSFPIEYTTEANPCRSELEGDFTDPWPAACVENYSAVLPANLADVTAFRVRVPFDIQPWPPGSKMRFSVPMLAPPGSPPSFPGDANFFNPAWNSFAHRARADDGLPGAGGLANLSAEPRKVGIVLEPSYRLGNLIWLDSDHDGRAEQGEPGIAGVAIELWEDTDLDGDASVGDSLVQSLVTDADGKYLFDDLHPGDYYVIIPDGQNGAGGPLENLFESQFNEEADPDGDADNNDNGVLSGAIAGGATTGLASGVVTLGVGGSYALSEPANEQLRANNGTDDDHDYYPDELSNFSIDIGYYRPFNLGNRVWLDNGAGTQANANNGLIDAGEAGIDGIQVILRSGNGGVYDADPDTAGNQELITTTANGGYYLFEDLPAGDYRVRIDLSGGNEHFKSSTGSNANAGPFEPAPDPDNDNDSVDDGSHVNATLIQSLRLTLGSSTNPVEPVVGPGVEQDIDASLANPQGDDPSGTGTAIPDNQANVTVDFGLFESYSIGNRVWIEDDDNGIFDGGELPLDGIAVRLFVDDNSDGVPDVVTPIATTSTSNGGHYRFDDVWAGSYIAEVDIPAGTRSSQVNAVETHATDSDDNGVSIFPTFVRSATVTVGPTGPTEVTDDAEYAPGGDASDAAAAIDDHSNLTVDFGFVREYSIGSYVWNDLNGDGVQGNPALELPLQNVTVALVDATSGLPVNDLDGVQVPSQNIGMDGEYFFSQLKAGDYKVQVTLPVPAAGPNSRGYIPSPVQTTIDNNDSANDSNIVSLVPATVGTYESGLFTLADALEPLEAGSLSGDELDDSADTHGNMTVDFGFYEPLTLGNLVWLDTDNDGLYNNGELGVNDVEVRLYRDDGDGNFEPGAGDVLVNTINTATVGGVDGLYQFNNLLTGDYFVFIPDSEFAAGQPLYRLVSSTGTGAGQPNTFEPAPDPDATDTDNDDSGSRDVANAGVVSAQVMLVANSEPLLEDPSHSGNPGDDGTIVNGVLHDDADSNLAVDFGFTPTMTIGSVVFSDNDDSGLQENGELGIPGVNVKLYRNSSNVEVPVGPDGVFGTADDAPGGMTTNAQGQYNFSGLSAGDYSVRVTPDARYEPSTIQVVDANLNVNLDSNIISESAGVYTSSVLTLVAFTEPTAAIENDPAGVPEVDPSNTLDDNANLTLDFGFIPPVSIGSFVWLDQNGNSLQDPGEPGIPNATIALLDSLNNPVILDMDGNAIAPVDLSTGVVGQYLFDNLRPGDYKLRVITAPGSNYLPALLQNGTPDDPLNIENDSNIVTVVSPNIFDSAVFTLLAESEWVELALPAVEVGDDQDDISIYATDDSGNMTVDFGFIRPVAIGSYVWEDTNGDGLQDATESGIENAEVVLLTGAGTPAVDVLGTPVPPLSNTPSTGLYEFTNLPPGTYRVQVTPPAGFAPSGTQTTTETNVANDSNIAGTGIPAGSYISAVFNLSPGLEPVEAGGFDGDTLDDGVFDFDGNMTVDFGFVQTVSIGSFVWEDLIINGVQDATEPTIENTTVELFVDDGTGAFIAATDVDQLAVASQSTGADGLYYFDNLPEGNYKVRVTPPSNYFPTPTQVGGDNLDTLPVHETDSNINTSPTVMPPAGSYESGVFGLVWGTEPAESNTEAGDNQDAADDLAGNMTVDFGFVQPVSIGSFVWEDTNGNGLQDAMEPMVTRGFVSLVNTSGAAVSDLDGNAVTAINLSVAANGLYFFDNLLPGDYRVRVALNPLDGYVPTPAQVSADNSDLENDSNIATVLAADSYESGLFSLSGGGEPTESGVQAGDAQDNTAIATEDSGNMTVDFGFVRPVSIGSFVWEDTNGDGNQDSGEPFIDGAMVALVDTSGNPVTDVIGAVVLSIPTAGGGLYQFTNLKPGDYRVRVTPPAGYDNPPSATQTTGNNDDTAVDSNIATDLGGGVYESGTFTLTVGGEPIEVTEAGDNQDNAAETDGNMTVDFGFVQSLSIGSFVWEDTNGDGVQDAAEPFINGATVTLVDTSGNPVNDLAGTAVAPVLTASGGLYQFTNLTPGDYRVRVTPPAGYINPPVATQTTGDNDDAQADSNIASEPIAGTYESGSYTLTVGGEPTEAGINAGDDQDDLTETNGNMTVDFGFIRPLSIASFVWQDSDADGVQDNGEPGIDGATVALVDTSGAAVTDADGAPVASVLTASGGIYQFTNLAPGDYRVRVTPPAGYDDPASSTQTTDDNDDSEADSNIASEPVVGTYESGTYTLTVGGEPVEVTEAGDYQDNATETDGNMTVDFGFVRPLSIASFVWSDINGDGIQDAGEPGIENATVALVDSNGNPVSDLDGIAITNVLSSPAGLYEFTNLLPGDYRVRVTPPAGYVDPPSSTQTTADNDDSEADSNIAGEPVTGTYESGTFTLAVGAEPTETGVEAGDDQDDLAENDGNMTVDFGFIRPLSIGSFAWEDTDDNGAQDSGEPGIEGAVMTLLDSSDQAVTMDMNGAPILPATTGSNGFYLFENLLPGDYKIKVEPPVALHLLPSATQTAADNNDADSDSNIATAAIGSYTSGLFTLGVGQEPGASAETQPGDAQDNASDADGNMSVDFGFVPAMAIGSTVFLDLDNNAIHDSGEPGMRAVVVELYAQGDVPGTDAPLDSTITNVAGNYLFDDLRQGDYFVYIPNPPVDAPKSSIDIASSTVDNQTDGDDNGQQSVSGNPVQSPLINLAVRAEPEAADESDTGGDQDDSFDANGDMTIDFGFIPSASIGNRVWLDIDKDGSQDANEIGIADATVVLWIDTSGDDIPDTPISSLITDTNGEYLFTDLEPGVAYEVRVDPASLHPLLQQTYDEGPTPGTTGPLDHTSVVIILTPNEEHLTADFGYSPPSGTIGDTIWIDTDGDGLQDSGEIGMPGVTVNLLDVDGNVLDTQVTNEQGKYLFTGLPAGIFGVVVDDTTLPPGYIAHPLGDPDVRDGIGFNHDNQTTVTLVVLPDASISSVLDADFGYMPPVDQNNVIGDTIWNDIDGDGNGPVGAGDESDVIEAVFPGVTVSLYEDFGTVGNLDSLDVIRGTAVTDSNGQYQFTGLPDGNYIVVVTDTSSVLAEETQVSDPDAVLDSTSYVDLDSAQLLPGYTDSDQDFGYTHVGDIGPVGYNGVIGDTIFFDVAEDGNQDAGDDGIEGVKVELYDDQGNLIDVAVTDENGHYLFTELPVEVGGSSYRVRVDTSTLPGGGSSWNNSADPDGGFDSESLTTLTVVDLVDLDQDFGYGGGINALEGTIWSDDNKDGVQDETETFEGVTVELLDPDTGNTIGRTITDSNGNYRFDSLPDGLYTVLVTDENKVLVGYEHTDGATGQDQNSQQDDGTYVVDLDSAGLSAAAVIDVTSDFGYTPTLTTPITLGSFASEALSAGEVRFSWTTHSEIANVGFMIYQHAEAGWIAVNDKLIPAVGESLDIETYEYIGRQITASEFVLVDVDSFGKQTVHGPFLSGEVFGTPEKLNSGEMPDWEAIMETPAGSATKQRQAQQQFKSALDSYLGR